MIREATVEDLDTVYHLICVLENQQLDYLNFKQKYLNALNSDNAYFFLYFQEENAVGFASLFVKDFLHHANKTGELVELIVEEKYRSMKIGEALLNCVEEQARKLDLEEVELCTSTWRKDAHRFYEKHGYILNHYNYIKKL